MVKLFVAVTDRNWFDFLATSGPEEVNFWAPSGRTSFRALLPGELFLFKLHAPANFIVGCGVFSHASNLPLSLAWEAFGQKNGVRSFDEMCERIAHYRKEGAADVRRSNPPIGCRILTAPSFWPRDLWIPAPSDWAQNTVVGKGYDTSDGEGAKLLGAVAERMALSRAEQELPINRYGTPVLVKPRLGQGAFRVLVTDAYGRKCAVSGERTLPILDAAHIRPYSDGGPHEGSNGLLLRTDIHKLFDLGYVTVDQDSKFVVSGRLKADFDNGRHYYDLHGAQVQPPVLASASPSSDALPWHRENPFRG